MLVVRTYSGCGRLTTTRHLALTKRVVARWLTRASLSNPPDYRPRDGSRYFSQAGRL